ncbi:FBD-associated F-box protein At3g52670-like [Vicia villosa]|uniref:FBD-associated F-box protein At3g52670-like n=1 Tax=Vicia villosa TaxID=3911 RepID=UPI00273B9E07|nr:FBD-associated F-box protein At3g52670-like [Vicia villosa]
MPPNVDDTGINGLPETVLCHILSFLSTKQAVATSVLSKRWIHLWCSVLSIEFTNIEVDDLEAYFRFNKSLYSVLLSRTSIKSFRLGIRYGGFHFGYIGIPHVAKWVDHVVQNGVEHLHLDVATRVDMPKLPASIITCKTLVVLNLNGFTVNDFSSIRLPSLKILHFESCTFLSVRAFLLVMARCPILEELQAAHIVFQSDDSLANQELKSLSFSKLIRVDMICCYCHFPLTALYNVESLRIEIDKMYRPHDEIPTFHNLTNLKLLSLNCNWPLLIQMLNHCPKLQKLDLSEANVDGDRDGVQENWVDPECVPECLSLSLRSCTLLEFFGRESELLMAKYILKNASLLQTMTITGPQHRDYLLSQGPQLHVNSEYIERELSSFPRASATCQLSFY